MIIGATVSALVLLVLVAVAAVSVLLWLRKRKEEGEAAVEQTVTSDDHIMESNPAYLVQSRTISAGVDTFPNSAYGAGLNARGMIVSKNEAYGMSNVVRGEVNDVGYESVDGDLQYDYITHLS